jgi:hypothetical protein
LKSTFEYLFEINPHAVIETFQAADGHDLITPGLSRLRQHLCFSPSSVVDLFSSIPCTNFFYQIIHLFSLLRKTPQVRRYSPEDIFKGKKIIDIVTKDKWLLMFPYKEKVIVFFKSFDMICSLFINL